MTLELLAPAKLNLCLEVLGRRGDGYHEVVSVMQTVDLADTVRLTEASTIELSVGGEQMAGVPLEGPRNLAYRAAVALAAEAGRRELGASIELVKNIPGGMGLGGGSTDAAAVLRGLNRLWGLGLELSVLERTAASVGSDVAFFLHGGTALVTGRGEIVEPLPDAQPDDYTLFLAPFEIEDKTRRMYSVLSPADYTDGHRAGVVAGSIRHGLSLAETDYFNAFDRNIGEVAPPMAQAMSYCRESGLPVLATGSGPGFFAPVPLAEVSTLLLRHIEHEWDVTALACRSLSRAEALTLHET
jgi:4-diphosphocytidyl-2-C-methyl-D-erythritol kinase